MTVLHLAPPVMIKTLEGDLGPIINDKWEKIPYAANSQAIAEAVKKTLASLNSPELAKPSILASLSDTVKTTATITAIDNAFVLAIESYRRDFINATANDFAFHLNPRDTAGDFTYAISVGAARLAKHTPNVPVLKYIIGPLLALIGSVYGMVNQNGIIKEKVLLEGSEHRRKWFEEVRVKEEERIKQAVALIGFRSDTLKDEIESGQLVNTGHVEELKALSEFTSFLSPETPLKINNFLVADYLVSRGI